MRTSPLTVNVSELVDGVMTSDTRLFAPVPANVPVAAPESVIDPVPVNDRILVEPDVTATVCVASVAELSRILFGDQVNFPVLSKYIRFPVVPE